MNVALIEFLIALALGGGLLAGGWKLGSDHEIASQAKAQKQVQDAVEAANSASAEAIAKLRPVYTTIQGRLETQFHTNTVYQDCKVPPEAMTLVNQALSGGLGSGKLPPVATQPRDAGK